MSLSVKAAEKNGNGNGIAINIDVGGQHNSQSIGIVIRSAALCKSGQFLQCTDGDGALCCKNGRAKG